MKDRGEIMELEQPFKLDRRGIWFLDDNDIKVEQMFFQQFNKPYSDRASFLKIDGIDNYIIKDCTVYPYFFNCYRNLKLLKKLNKKQKDIDNIDFPVAYYKSEDKLKGIVIPYYKDAVSLTKLISFYSFDDLKNYYNHDNDEINNLISLLLEILELLKSMYDKGVFYLDIHSGNFLIYDNGVKVIDFEPGHVFFRDKNWHLKIILNNYSLLVDRIRRKYNFKEVFFHSGEDFYNTEMNVKALKKRLER